HRRDGGWLAPLEASELTGRPLELPLRNERFRHLFRRGFAKGQQARQDSEAGPPRADEVLAGDEPNIRVLSLGRGKQPDGALLGRGLISIHGPAGPRWAARKDEPFPLGPFGFLKRSQRTEDAEVGAGDHRRHYRFAAKADFATPSIGRNRRREGTGAGAMFRSRRPTKPGGLPVRVAPTQPFLDRC